MEKLNRESVDLLARYHYEELIAQFMVNQELLEEQHTAINQYEATLNQISSTLPDTNKTLWWLTNLIKIISLIVEIIKNAPKRR